jgi:hypothetical protein
MQGVAVHSCRRHPCGTAATGHHATEHPIGMCEDLSTQTIERCGFSLLPLFCLGTCVGPPERRQPQDHAPETLKPPLQAPECHGHVDIFRLHFVDIRSCCRGNATHLIERELSSHGHTVKPFRAARWSKPIFKVVRSRAQFLRRLTAPHASLEQWQPAGAVR